MSDKDLVYECFDCKQKEIVKSNDPRVDGRSCKHCGGHIIPIRHAIVGVDLGKGNDFSVIDGKVIENKLSR